MLIYVSIYFVYYFIALDKTQFVVELEGFSLFKVYYYIGIFITGGGALLHGIDHLLVKELKVPVFVAESPLDSVALGTGILLENINKLKKY